MDLPLWKAVVLGLVQGLTEFLPVSSSGHLLLFEHLLGFNPPGITFEIVAHLGTLLAVLVVYREDLAALVRGALDLLRRGGRALDAWSSRWALLLLVGTAPAAVVALGFSEAIDRVFDHPHLLGLEFIVTGTLLWLAQRWGTRARGVGEEGFGARHALVMGLFQALAILPGVSRSGSTVAGGLLAGVRPDTAARFSFLLVVPAIAGAALLDLLDGSLAGEAVPAVALAVAFVTSAVSGYAAIRYFLRALARGRLMPFAVYTWALGALVLLILR